MECCYFYNYYFEFCNLLNEKIKCDGYNKNCSFFKTAEQYESDFENAIMLNRKKGNCEKCSYRKKCDRCLTKEEQAYNESEGKFFRFGSA